MLLALKDTTLDLSAPVVMGIVNVTPDSFSDGGRWFDPEEAIAHARALSADGAALVDVGGESTRPGAADVPAREETGRVVPVIRGLAGAPGAPISVDTSKPEVMLATAAAGAAMINDVRALQAPGALEAAAETGCAVCLMHMRGEPRTMQDAPAYGDVVEEVRRFLAERIEAAVRAGIAEERIVVDPGFGFGKSVEHNLTLIRHLDRLVSLGRPVLVGVSRKSTLGSVTGRDVGERLAAGLALAALAVDKGARIIRTHDVAPTVDAVKMAAAVGRAGKD